MSAAGAIRFDHITKEYPGGQHAVVDVSFSVPRGQFVVLVGPSGCGKTTLLKTVNRLVEPTSGTVFVNDRDVRDIEPTSLRRGIGYVIQQVGLFPHMTVSENVAVVPRLLGWQPARIHQRVEELLDLMRLPMTEYDSRYPAELSGGQQQRVGIARALAADPAILLMDEPFGALDAIERSRLQAEVAVLQRSLRKTVLFVTHDVDEALRLADAMVVMRSGRVEQYAQPSEVLLQPASPFVAQLVGAEDIVRRLTVMRVEMAMTNLPADGAGTPADVVIEADSDLKSALSKMVATGSFKLRVVDANASPQGWLTIQDMLAAARSGSRT